MKKRGLDEFPESKRNYKLQSRKAQRVGNMTDKKNSNT